MGWESHTAGLSYLSTETMVAIKAHELLYRKRMCTRFRVPVLLSDHKVPFVFAGVVAIHGSDREMMRDLCS